MLLAVSYEKKEIPQKNGSAIVLLLPWHFPQRGCRVRSGHSYPIGVPQIYEIFESLLRTFRIRQIACTPQRGPRTFCDGILFRSSSSRRPRVPTPSPPVSLFPCASSSEMSSSQLSLHTSSSLRFLMTDQPTPTPPNVGGVILGT